MALTESSMVSLGTQLPNFRLPDTDGTYYSSDDFSDRPLLVMFICNHCPYVKHIAAELSLLSRDFAQARLGMVAIQSNDIEGYPEEHFFWGLLGQMLEKEGIPFEVKTSK